MSAEIKNGQLIIRAPQWASDAEVRRFILKNQSWIETHFAKAQEREQEKAACPKLTQQEIRALTDQARRLIPERVAYYAPLVGVRYGTITIRCQHTRWGSCTAKGNLSFNCLLMLTPPEVIDSVVVHELCHRKYMNHSARFYAEVLHVYPEYKKWNKWLKQNGELIMSRRP